MPSDWSEALAASEFGSRGFSVYTPVCNDHCDLLVNNGKGKFLKIEVKRYSNRQRPNYPFQLQSTNHDICVFYFQDTDQWVIIKTRRLLSLINNHVAANGRFNVVLRDIHGEVLPKFQRYIDKWDKI